MIAPPTTDNPADRGACRQSTRTRWGALGLAVVLGTAVLAAVSSTPRAGAAPVPVPAPVTAPAPAGTAHACAPASPAQVTCFTDLVSASVGAGQRATRAHLASPHTTYIPAGLGPWTIHSAYAISTNPAAGTGKTVAIVDAYNDPSVVADLAQFSTQYNLPACTTANGCFTQVNQTGGATLPANNAGWGIETSLDVQWVHATAPGAKILLVEATTAGWSDMFIAEQQAMARANYVSNSWGGPEWDSETYFDATMAKAGVSVFAATGDSGSADDYPAASPNVIAVGGTMLNATTNGTFTSEVAWPSGGGACSHTETATPAQAGFAQYPAAGCAGKRAMPDVAAVAGSQSSGGLAVVDTSYSPGTSWMIVVGTSAATPILAAAAAVRSTTYGPAAVYDPQATLRPITAGANGTGTSHQATAQFNLATGRGAPVIPNPTTTTLSATTTPTAGIGQTSATAVTTAYGVGATLTARVTSATAGTVSFASPTAGMLCANVALVTRTATCIVPAAKLPTGSYTVTAAYSSGTAAQAAPVVGITPAYAASVSAPLAWTVAPDVTTTTLTAQSAASAPQWSIVLAAAVASAPAAASGTVAFQSNGTDVAGCTQVPLVAGTATCTSLAAIPRPVPTTTATLPSASTSAPLPAAHAAGMLASSSLFTATFTPTPTATVPNFAPSTGSVQVASPAGTGERVTLATTGTGSLPWGAPVTLVQTVTSQLANVVATGTVTFTAGTTVLCANVPLTGASASCTTRALAPGQTVVVATFTTTNPQTPSAAAAITEQVTPATTATTLAVTPVGVPAPAPFGTPVRVTATTTPTQGAPGPPTGTWVIAGATAGVLCTGPTATLPVVTDGTSAVFSCLLSGTALAAGTDTLAATFTATATATAPYASSTSAGTSWVTAALPTKVTLAASTTSPSPYGVGFTLTAAATCGGHPAAGQIAITYLGAFHRPNTVTGTVAADGTLAWGIRSNAIDAGSQTFTAQFTGTTACLPSAVMTLPWVVVPDPTTTAVTTTTASPSATHPVVLTATVTGYTTAQDGLSATAGIQVGTVAFTANGTPIAGCAALVVTYRTDLAGTATCTSSQLPAGRDTITATYSDPATPTWVSNFHGSTGSLTLVVGA